MSGTALPRPARSSIAPPTGPLPSLPVSKQRPSNIGSPSLRSPSTSSLANPAARAVSSPYRPGPKYAASSTPSSPPTEHPPPNPLSGGKSLRKAVSIGAFPQPPRHASRNPSSPLSTASSVVGDSVDQRLSSSSITSAKSAKSTKSAPSTRNNSLQKPRVSNIGGARGLLPKSPLSPPSFLNGSADASTVDTSHLNLPSPPQSRNSSPQSSYTTSATTYEDGEDETRGRSEDRNSTAKDGKGNVLVSVRVRPDAGAKDHAQDMDWEVNNKQALISYRGREGGEYIYGKTARR
jgi:centromeric protein E